jgi:hypothetical protein
VTAKDFFTALQGYYGMQYPAGQTAHMARWVADKSEAFLGALFDAVIYNFSSRFKTLPDIAVFEELRGDAMARLRGDSHALSAPDLPAMSDAEHQVMLGELEKIYARLGWQKGAKQ